MKPRPPFYDPQGDPLPIRPWSTDPEPFSGPDEKPGRKVCLPDEIKPVDWPIRLWPTDSEVFPSLMKPTDTPVGSPQRIRPHEGDWWKPRHRVRPHAYRPNPGVGDWGWEPCDSQGNKPRDPMTPSDPSEDFPMLWPSWPEGDRWPEPPYGGPIPYPGCDPDCEVPMFKPCGPKHPTLGR